MWFDIKDGLKIKRIGFKPLCILCIGLVSDLDFLYNGICYIGLGLQNPKLEILF